MRLKLPLTIFLEVALETPRLKTRALSESKNYIEIYFNTVSHTKHPKMTIPWADFQLTLPHCLALVLEQQLH